MLSEAQDRSWGVWGEELANTQRRRWDPHRHIRGEGTTPEGVMEWGGGVRPRVSEMD